MTRNSILKRLLNIKGATVEDVEFEEVGSLVVRVRPVKREQWRCPVCGRHCGVYDHAVRESRWRSMDFGPVQVRIVASVPRVSCPEHGVHMARVPWARPGIHFTTDFAYSAAWMFKGGLSRKRLSEWLHVDWCTVGRLVESVRNDLEPDPKARCDGMVNVGTGETAYGKGHKYITVVVNHDTNTVVWAHEGHGKEIPGMFFEELTEEQRASIRLVSGDGARWITDTVEQYCPNATRCLDLFHAVEWANEAQESLRRDAWRKARADVAELKRRLRESDSPDDGEAKEAVRQAQKEVDRLKHAKYALGKNPENLTEGQRERLKLVQAEDPRLKRGHDLKERLRLIFGLTDADLAEEALDRWLGWARRCRIPAFVELGRKVRRHREHILNTVRHRLSNARVEALNNKIKLLIRIAFGFRNVDTLINLVMLFCSSLEIPWPGRGPRKPGK